MRVIQAYIQGAKHKSENRPCEDRTYALSKNDVNVIALADGAGSAKYSHSANGAECVTKTICEFFCNNFDKFYEKSDVEELKNVIVAVCQHSLSELATELELDDISRLSSTLLCVAVKNEKAIICHIGDGVIGKLTSTGIQTVSTPDNGEFVGTTYFITSANAQSHMTIIKEKSDDVISYFMMSDGTQEYIYDKGSRCFSGAAKKMALMSLEDGGQDKLVGIMKKYMVDKDPKSDDCSFICLTLNTNSILQTVSNADVKITERYSEDVVVSQKSSSENTQGETNEYIEFFKRIFKDKTRWIVIVSVIMVLVIAVTVGMSRKKQKKPNETTKTTIAEIKTEEKTTSKDVVIDCDKNSVSKENGKSENKEVVEKITENKQKPDASSTVNVTEKTTKEKVNENE